MLSAENVGSLPTQASSLPDPITNCYYTYGFADEDSDFDEMDIDNDALLNADTKSLSSEFVSIDDAVKHGKESNSDLLNTTPIKKEPLTNLDSTIRNIFYVFKDFEDNCKQNNSGCFPLSRKFKHFTPLKNSTAYDSLKNKEVHSDTVKEAKCFNLYKPHNKKEIESPSKNNDLFTIDLSHYVWPKSTSVTDDHLLQDARSVSEFYRPKKLSRTIKSHIYKGLYFFTNALDPRQQCDNGNKPSLKDGKRTQDDCISLKASETSEHFTANSASHDVKCMKFSPARDSPKHTASQNSGEICKSKPRNDAKESTKSTPVKNIAETSLTSNDKRDFSKSTPVKNVSKVATSKAVSRKSVKHNPGKNIVEIIIGTSDINSATKFSSAITSETSLTSERKNSSKSVSDQNISELSIINNEVSTAKNLEVYTLSTIKDKDSTKLTPSKDSEVNILCKEKDSTRVTPVAEIRNSTTLSCNTSCRDTNFDLSPKNSCNVSALDAGVESVHNPKRNLNSEINADKPVLTISNNHSQNAVEKIEKSKLKRKMISDDTEATKKKMKEVSPENPDCVQEKVSDIMKCSSCFLTHLAQVRDATVGQVHSKPCSQCGKGNKLVCPKCDLQCPNLLVLYAHLLNVSNKQHKKVAQFCCSSCKMLSDSQFHFYNHVAFSNCSKLCIFCDHIFKSRKQKDSHTCKKAGTKKYFKRLSISSEVILQCQTCSKVVTSAKVKTGAHYNCDQCLKSKHKKPSRQTVSVKEYKDRQKEKECKKDCVDSITAKSNSHVKDNSALPEGLKKQPPSDIMIPGLNQDSSIENIANVSAIHKNCNASVNIQSREVTSFTISINNAGSKLENENPATPSTDKSEIFTNHVSTCHNTPDDTNVKSSRVKIKDSSLNAQSLKGSDCTDIFKSTKDKLKIVNSEGHSTRSPVLKLFCNELKANTSKITVLNTQVSPSSTKSPETSTNSAIASRKMSPGVADTTKVKLSSAYTAKSSKTEVSSSNVLKSSETKLGVSDKKLNSMENTSSKSKPITKTLSPKINDSLSFKKKTTTTNTNNSVSEVSDVKSPTIKRSHTLELRKSPVKRPCLLDMRNQEDIDSLQKTLAGSSTSPSIKVPEAKVTPSLRIKPAAEVLLNTSDKHAAVKKGSSTHKAAVKEIPTSEKPTITKTNSLNKLEVGMKVSCTDKLITTDAASKQSITMSKPEKSKVNGLKSTTSALTEITGSKPPDTEICFDKTEVILTKIITSPKPAVDKIKKVDKGSREINALDIPTVTKETKITKSAVKVLKTPKPEVTSVNALPKPGGCKDRSATIKVNNTLSVSISENNDSDKETATEVVPFDKPALPMVNTTKSVVNKANTSKSEAPQVTTSNKPALSRINTKTTVPNIHTSEKPASSDSKNDKPSNVITTSTPKPVVSKLTASNKSAISKVNNSEKLVVVAGGNSIAKPKLNQDNALDEKRPAVTNVNTATEPKASKVNTVEKSAVGSVSTSKKSTVTEVTCVSKTPAVTKLNVSNKLAVTKVNVSKPTITKVITLKNSVVAGGNIMPKPKVNPDKTLDSKRPAVAKVNTATESKVSKITAVEKPAVCSVSTSSSNKKLAVIEVSVSEKPSVTKSNASNKSVVSKVITLSKTAEIKVSTGTSETSLVAGGNSVLVPKSIVTQDNILEDNRSEATKVNTLIKSEEETAVTNVTSETLVTNMNASNEPALVKVDSQDPVTSLDETNATLTKMIPSEEKNISQTNVTALDNNESHLKSSSIEPKCICKQNSSLPDSTSLDSICSSNNPVLNSVAPKGPVSDLVKVVSESNSPQYQQSNGLSSAQASVIHTDAKCPLYPAQDITKCEIPKSEQETQTTCKENNKKTDKLTGASHTSGGSSNCNKLSTNIPPFCRICGWGARSYYYLDEHLAGAHHMKRKYFCRVGPCNCNFVLERCLDIHREEHDYMDARNSNMEQMHTERPNDWCADASFYNPKTRCQTFMNSNAEWQGSRCGDAENASFRNYNSFDDMDVKSRRQSFHNANRFENVNSNTGMPTFPARKRFADSFDDLDCMIAKKVCQSSGVFNACKTDCYGRPVVVQVYQFISTSDHVSVNYIQKSNYPHSNVRVINMLPYNHPHD